LPSEEARLKILQVHLEGEELDSVDLAAIAKQTNLYSGSDLKNMCVAAALYRIKEDLLIAATKQDPIMKDASHAEIMG
jgi:SpoVK/Ycf46/Vps4 family AAA+-type ATPase